MQTLFRIQRFDPKKDKEPRFEEFRLDTRPTDKLLDCLNRIRWEQAPSLALRMSCGHGVCGSDGMKINGVCTISCQRLIRDYPEGEPITIEPLANFPVLKDLVVDMDMFFEKYSEVRPYLLPKGEAPDKERLQSPEERKKFEEAIRCILCGSCTSCCPAVTESENNFLGPAALLRAFRYLFDSRDGAGEERLKGLDDSDGIWGCKTYGVCTKVCPKEIPVTKDLAFIKLKEKGKLQPGR